MHLRFNSRRAGRSAATAAAVVALPLALAVPAGADPGAQAERALRTYKASDVKRHLQALQAIANANGGTRASGTPGFAASRDYVVRKLKKAGYNVTVQPFEFPFFFESSTAVLQQLTPDAKTYTPTPPGGDALGDFATMTYSGAGDVTGTVQAVDVTLPPAETPNSSTSGCEAEDFAGFTPGDIALVQRGTCTFEQKAKNAVAAGAKAVIVFNEGQAGRTDAIQGTLNQPGITVPVVGASFATGADLADPAGTTVRVKTDTQSEVRTTYNVIADSKKGRADHVVMTGSHLDSVVPGPGINDNGSGSAATLEVALRLAKLKTENRLRFAWWGAEEFGLLGSEHYVASLPEAERAKIKLYLNYDMVASPNFAYMIYDGDDSDGVGAPAGPAGSDAIEKTFEKYYELRKLPHIGTDFTGRSDYGPFIEAGIPAGGLFTGAEGVKTAEQATLFGGTAGEAYDHCYHQACDTIANVNDTALGVNTGAIAFATLTYAFTKDLPGGDAAPAAARSAVADSAARTTGGVGGDHHHHVAARS